MMDKFFVWFGNNRKAIGYTIGGVNILSGINFAFQGNYGLALLWLVIGGALILDSHQFK
jgi:hypothetical protein